MKNASSYLGSLFLQYKLENNTNGLWSNLIRSPRLYGLG